MTEQQTPIPEVVYPSLISNLKTAIADYYQYIDSGEYTQREVDAKRAAVVKMGGENVGALLEIIQKQAEVIDETNSRLTAAEAERDNWIHRFQAVAGENEALKTELDGLKAELSQEKAWVKEFQTLTENHVKTIDAIRSENERLKQSLFDAEIWMSRIQADCAEAYEKAERCEKADADYNKLADETVEEQRLLEATRAEADSLRAEIEQLKSADECPICASLNSAVQTAQMTANRALADLEEVCAESVVLRAELARIQLLLKTMEGRFEWMKNEGLGVDKAIAVLEGMSEINERDIKSE